MIFFTGILSSSSVGSSLKYRLLFLMLQMAFAAAVYNNLSQKFHNTAMLLLTLAALFCSHSSDLMSFCNWLIIKGKHIKPGDALIFMVAVRLLYVKFVNGRGRDELPFMAVYLIVLPCTFILQEKYFWSIHAYTQYGLIPRRP